MSTRKLLIVSGSLALLLALAGCGTDEGTGTSPTGVGQVTMPAEATTQAEPQPTESPTTPAIEMRHGSTLQMHNGGYRAQVTIRQGDLMRAEPGLVNGSISLDADCPVDPQRDAIVPYEVELTNKTENFSATFGLTWLVSREGTDNRGVLGARVQVGEVYTSDEGPMCEIENARHRASSGLRKESLESGDSVRTQGFLILKNYYNPDYPDGDVEAVRHVVIAIVDVHVNDARKLEGSNPGGGMHKLQNGFVNYGVSFVPSQASKNCVIYKKVDCPES